MLCKGAAVWEETECPGAGRLGRQWIAPLPRPASRRKRRCGMSARAAVSSEPENPCIWVDSDSALAAAAAHWRGVVGLDAEFQRTDTFHPIPALYQLASEAGVWFVDPLAIEDWTPFVEVLADPATVKVLHACPGDLELIHHHLGLHPNNLFDTQLAHAFLSEEISVGYAALVEALLGRKLPKHQTRSDWLRRPLSEEQLRYAEQDAAHLPALYAKLQGTLRASGRWNWFAEDMARLGRHVPKDPSAYFASLNKAWTLDGRQLAVLRSLCAWRERRAMADDLPRNWVVCDEHLFAFAQRDALAVADVQRALPKGVARRYARALVRAHRQGRHAPSAPPLPRPPSSAQNRLLAKLRTIGRQRAAALGLAPELLARRRDLQQCVRCHQANGQLPEAFRGWRHAQVGEQFAACLANAHDECASTRQVDHG